MSSLQNFVLESTVCITQCIFSLQSSYDNSLIAQRLESIILAAEELIEDGNNLFEFVTKLEHAVTLLTVSPIPKSIGRPRIQVDMCAVERLLSMHFKGTQVAALMGISYRTFKRHLHSNGISIRGTYTQISQEDLEQEIIRILGDFPDTGYKKMKGFLRQKNMKVQEYLIRETIRVVDPLGVYYRTRRNRAIVRRQYFVRYSNEMWHIDAHMKLIRWKFVIRGGIDGKSRTCVYLDAGTDNRASSQLSAFIKGTQQFGVPLRCRSDKGGENTEIARFMIDNRGLGRASHICGRSVHNQRIERFWRDVHSGCLTQFKAVFLRLEDDGYLNVEDEWHLALLHYVFLPRLQTQLKIFQDAWNHHPLSTSQCMTPLQLMYLHLPPRSLDITIPMLDDNENMMNSYDDISRCMDGNPTQELFTITEAITRIVATRVASVNPMAESESFGYDIYMRAFDMLSLERYPYQV